MDNIDFAKDLIERCNKLNLKLYLVGGSIRDYLLFNKFDDIDFASPNKSNQLISALSINKYDKYSIKFGTIKTKINDKDIQITTFRKDKYSKNNRHPLIKFTKSMFIDSFRRDFTINALYLDNNKIYDYHNGLNDLKHKKITSIINPFISFKQDPLRMIRMIRFSSVLNFNISKFDLFALSKSKKYLNILSKDKINEEIKKWEKYKSIDEIKEVLYKYKLFDYIKDKMI